jgi:ERCC4-type nuclease
MTFTLQIDYREFKLIELLKMSNTKHESINLHIGDVQIKKDETIILVIERKCISDFCSSISDGRYKEQKQRLLELTCEKMYIIEGNINCDMKKTLQSAIINMMFRDNIHVFRTDSLEETHDTILSLMFKYNNGKFIEKINIGIVLKKSDKINNDIFVNQLCCITGISKNSAFEISKMYPSMKSLINASVDSLKDIQINKKKLGKKMAEKIIESFNTGKLLNNTKIESEICLL